MVVHHAGRVVHCQADLVVPLAGFGPAQPDLVLAELAGNVGDDLPHVKTLAGAVVAPVSVRANTHTQTQTHMLSAAGTWPLEGLWFSFSCSLEFSRLRGLQDETQLLAQLLGQGRGQVLVLVPHGGCRALLDHTRTQTNNQTGNLYGVK